MSDRIKKIKIKQADGTFSDYIPIGANAKDIDLQYNGSNVENTLKKKPYYYDSVAAMKLDDTLKEGDMAITLGYYEANDGGGAEYEIVSNNSSDNGIEILLNNNLKAKLIIINNTINFKQLGAKSNEKYDNKEYIEMFLSYVNNTDKKLTLFIPSGIYYFSPTVIEAKNGCDIKGIESFPHGESVKGTVLTTLTENQQYLFQIGNISIQQNISLKNIVFSTSDYIYDEKNKKYKRVSPYKAVSDVCVRICNTQYSITDNLFFMNINGSALAIRNSWEIYFGLLNFRGIAGFSDTKGVMIFEKRLAGENGNITACTFEKIMFEGFSKHLITMELGAAFGHCDFNTINIEDYPTQLLEGEITTSFPTDGSDLELPSDYHSVAVLDIGDAEGIIINNILLNNISYRKREYENITYVFDTIVKVRNNAWMNVIINNIITAGMHKNSNLVLQEENVIPNHFSVLTFNNISRYAENDAYKYILNVHGFPYIRGENLNLDRSRDSQSLEINSNFDAFYKLVNLSLSVPRGLLYYDEKSINHLKLVVKPPKEDESGDKIFAKWYSPCNKMMIRAKIPNGETARLQYRIESGTSADNKNADLIGTGEYKWYTIFSESPSTENRLQLNSTYLNTDCYIDCIRFE